MLSAAKGFLEISKLLLQYNASPFILDIYHKNAIDRAKNIEMITLLQTCKKHMKRSKSLLIFNNFPIFFKIDIKRFKKSKIVKKVSIRMNEKMIELKNHLSTKFERFLYEIITEENNKANLLISNSVNNWIFAYSQNVFSELTVIVKNISQSKLPGSDLDLIFDEQYCLAINKLKSEFRDRIKQKIAKNVKTRLTEEIFSFKPQIFYSISSLLADVLK